MRIGGRAGIQLVLAAAMAACAQPETPLPRDLPRWTLSAAPMLRIGAEGNPNTEFLRIARVTRMPTGEIVVGNSETAELRVFSPSGEFMRSLSRRGQGPGELENFSNFFRAGDTLFVTDFAPGSTRLSVFTLADGFRTRMPVRATNARSPSPSARLSSGEFLVSPVGFRVVGPVAGVMWRDTSSLGILRVAEEPGVVVSLGSFEGTTLLGYRSPSMRDGVGLAIVTIGPSLVSGASGDRVWIGDSGTGAITLFDAAGRQVAQMTVPIRPRAFSEAALDRAKVRAVASADRPNMAAMYENLYDPSYRPRTAPLFTRFIPGTDGQMVVELFEEEERAVPRSAIVLDRDGTPVAGFVIPAGVVIHEIGDDYLLGVHFDDDGIERVVQYRVQR